MATQLSLYNGALGHLGPVRLDNLSENRPDRRELDAKYDETKAFMLERGLWRFALRTQEWEAETDVEPQFGLQYAFLRPEDYGGHLRFIATDERQEYEDKSFREEGSYWFSDHNILYVTYVSNGPLWGGNLGAWPQLYADAFSAELAYRADLPITKDKVSKATVEQTAAIFLARAKRNHAIDERVKFKPASTWVTSRLNGGYGDQRRERT